MAIIIGVKFKGAGKVYYFDPDEAILNAGDYVVVETSRGIECGTVTFGNREINDDGLNRQKNNSSCNSRRYSSS